MTWVNAVPSVTINQAATQVDPTTTSPITFDVVFSEAVTGFGGSDVDFTGSTAGSTLVAGVSGSGANYTISVTGMSASATVVASIPAGAAQDEFGSGNSASTSTDNTVTFVAPEFGFVGFFSPLPGSSWKRGQTIPVKFALVDANNMRISAQRPLRCSHRRAGSRSRRAGSRPRVPRA